MNFSAIRSSKKIVLALAGIAAISLSTASPAFADEAAKVPVQLNIANGGLTLSVDPKSVEAGVSLYINSDKIQYGVGGTATGSFSYIVDDARGLDKPSGWQVNAQVKDFVGPNNESISATNLTGGSEKVETIAGVNGQPKATGQGNNLGESSVILVADGLNGAGRFQSNLDMSLAVPQYARPGDYKTVLVISVVAGPQ